MKKVPEKPRVLNNGTLSKAINSQLSTTYPLYDRAIKELAEKTDQNYGKLRQQYDDVLDELAGRGYSDFFQEVFVRKTQNEITAQAQDIWQIGLEMVRPSTPVYPAPEWLKCQFCQFKAPCKIKNAGGNYEQILEHEYRERHDEATVEAAQKIDW
jgi:hypothetical protein